MEAVVLLILKSVASTCLKMYIAKYVRDRRCQPRTDGARIRSPRLVFEEGQGGRILPFGTSVEGDEFEALADAKQKAGSQMAKHIRLSHEQLAAKAKYDKDSVKQRRLVELFTRAKASSCSLR